MPDDPTTGLRSVDPLAKRSVDEDELAKGREARVSELVACDSEPEAPAVATPRPSRFRYLPLGATLGIVGVIAVVVLLTGNDGDSKDGSAYAAQVVRFAESTPLVLLEPPDWQVDYVDSSPSEETDLTLGTISFNRTAENGPPTHADLSWFKGSLEKWRRNRAHGNTRLSSGAPVLGTTAHVYRYGFRKGLQDITALWLFDGRIMELRSTVPDEMTFLAMLSSLKHVDAETWLDAMPESVIKAADTSMEIERMLNGVPLPPGFDSSEINVPGLAQDRYQVGTYVAGSVVCSWIAYWSEARRNADETAETKAVEAMATARDWPILQQMHKQGGYAEAIWDYAKQMPSGNWSGRPLESDVDTGLGCRERGVELRGRAAPRMR